MHNRVVVSTYRNISSQKPTASEARGLLTGFFSQKKSRSTIFKHKCKNRVMSKQMDKHSDALNHVRDGLERVDQALNEMLVTSVSNSYEKCLASFKELNHKFNRCSDSEKNHMRSSMIFFAHVAQGSLPNPDGPPTEFVFPNICVNSDWVSLVYESVLKEFVLQVVERAIETGLNSLDLQPTCIRWWSAVDPLASGAEAANSSRLGGWCNSTDVKFQQTCVRRSEVFKERLCRFIVGDIVRILDRIFCSFFRNRFCAVAMAAFYQHTIRRVGEITKTAIDRRVYFLRTDPLRNIVRVRPYAWHWYRVYQESICKEGGAGRAFDRDEYEEFHNHIDNLYVG